MKAIKCRGFMKAMKCRGFMKAIKCRFYESNKMYVEVL